MSTTRTARACVLDPAGTRRLQGVSCRHTPIFHEGHHVHKLGALLADQSWARELMTMLTKLTMASLLLATTAALRPPPVRATSFAPSMSSQNPQSRRALLLGALGTAVTLGNAKQAFAAAPVQEALASEDLSMPEASASGGIAVGMISVGEGQTKQKVNGTAQRIKDLKALGGKITDKQKKEMKRLQQEEMCDLLGRGC